MFWYQILNVFFMVLHPAIIIFNLFGWIWKKTRLANLILLLLTGGSWFILGIFYGIGYCPITQWYYDVLHHLGKTDLPDSYIQYLAEKLTGATFSSQLVNTVVAICYFAALGISLYVNLRGRKKSKSGTKPI